MLNVGKKKKMNTVKPRLLSCLYFFRKVNHFSSLDMALALGKCKVTGEIPNLCSHGMLMNGEAG